MSFVRPTVLWTLLLLLPVVWFHWSHRTGLGRIHAGMVAFARMAALALWIVALARPVVDRPDTTRTHVAVVDVSASVTNADLERVKESLRVLVHNASSVTPLRLITFDRSAREVRLTHNLLNATGIAWAARGDAGTPPPAGSALADALELAGAMIPQGGRGEVVLYSDGLETSGDARAAAYRLGHRGITIAVHPLSGPKGRDVVLQSVSVPAAASLGEMITVSARIEAVRSMPARFVVRDEHSGEEIRIPLMLRPGEQEVSTHRSPASEGVQRYVVRVESDDDSQGCRDTLPASVRILPPRAVCVAESGTEHPAARALIAMLGMAANVKPVAPSVLADEASLKTADLLVLSDVPADAIGEVGLKVIRNAVSNGMGLLVAGGRSAFGPGGYADTHLADILPVRSLQNNERRDPSATLVVIIDTSGSMGGERVSLAKEIARLSLRRLKPHDKAGIVEFYGSRRWAAPIQPASNAIDLQRALNRLSSGGGTVILPAIEEAYYALLNVRTRTRHVLVLTDGGVETGAFEPLIRKMADKGITVSTVLVGPEAHSAFLSGLAQWGRGRFYAAPDRFNLPEIIVKQSESSLLSPFVEKPTALLPERDLSVLQGVDLARAPKITGYVETEPRPTADLVLRSGLGHPILATWQYGLGKVAAWTTHLCGDWANDLARWPEYPVLISNLSRSLYGVRADRAFDIRPHLSAAGLEVGLIARAGAGTRAFEPIDLAVTDPAGKELRHSTLDPIGSHEWNERFTDLVEGTYLIDAHTSDGRAMGSAAVTVPPIREIYRLGPDLNLLKDLQELSGRHAAELARVERKHTRPTEIWPLLAAIGLATFLLNVLIRRWPAGRLRLRSGAAMALILLVSVTLASQPALGQTTTRVTTSSATQPAAAELLHKDTEALEALNGSFTHDRDPASRFAIGVRRLQLLYDTGKADEARAAIPAIVEAGQDRQAAATYCAHLASLCGDTQSAAQLLEPSGKSKKRFHEHLFRGAWLLRQNEPMEAGREFERAYACAELASDRRYALERRLAAARQGGTLKDLADRWIADETLPADRMMALVGILAEVGRSDEALRLLRRAPRTHEQQQLIESVDFQRDLVAVAIDAGEVREAESVYRSLIEKEPRQVQYRTALARLLLLEGRRTEAEQLLRQGVDQIGPSDTLMELADGARKLALDDVVLAATAKAGAANAGARVRSLLFEADLARQRGDISRAFQLLGKLRDVAHNDPTVMRAAADAFERYGDKAEALRLFRQVHTTTGSEDTALRLAWLLEQNERLDEAYAVWKDLWHKTEAPARRSQSQVRLLDLAARTGKLGSLAVELEERLDEGKGGERELTLLADIYTGANDPVSAAEILGEFVRRSGRKVDMLKQLAKVYLKCEQFGRCNTVLRQLVVQDPNNADDYLQQIAMVALERHQPAQAKAALAELASLSKGESIADEFSAGVLDMIGLHDEAIRGYERVLTMHPDRVEVHLLWGNAMKAAGQADSAIGRFQNLAETAVEDDLFTVAIDGLLNLQAPPTVLRPVLRRIRERIATTPDKVFLYRLAADLLEAMGRKEPMNQVLEQAVVVAGERRGSFLRELMDGAKTEGKTDDVIRFGRALFGLGEEVPPQTYIDLGEALLKTDQLAAASRVFRRVGLEGDFAVIQQRVASCYEQLDMPDQADRIIRELLIGQPDHVGLLMTSGGLCEQMGKLDRAFEQYDRAATIMLRRLPTVVRASQTTSSTTAESRKRQPDRQATNLDEMSQFFDSAVSGLLNTARTPACQQQLVRTLQQWTIRELGSLIAGRTLAPTLKENPRLDNLVRFLRIAAFSLHVPGVADEVDRKVIASYPIDRRLPQQSIEARTEWGLHSRASAIAPEGPSDPAATSILIERLSGDPGKLKAFLSSNRPTPEMAMRLAPLLIMTNQEGLLHPVLDTLKSSVSKPLDDASNTLFTASVALNDHESLRTWLRISIEACGRDRGGQAASKNLEQIVRLAWNFLSDGERVELVQQIGRVAAEMGPTARPGIDLFRMKLAERARVPFPEKEEVIQAASKDTTLPIEALAELLARLPAQDRPAMLEAMVSARKAELRRPFLLGMLGALDISEDDRLVATIHRLFKQAPKPRTKAANAYSTLSRSPWNRNPKLPRAAYAIAETLLSEQPDDPASMAVVAMARHHAGKHDAAMLLVFEAVEAFTTAKELKYDEERILTDLGGIMNAQDLDKVIADLRNRQDIEGATPTLLFAQGLLLLAGDRTDDAIVALREAFRLAPEHLGIGRRFIMAMKETGRQAELSQTLAATLTKSTLMQTYPWQTLTESYVSLHNLLGGMRTAQRMDGPLAPIEVMRIAAMMGDHDRVLRTLRRFLIRNRNERRFYSPFWPEPPSLDGMKGFSAHPNTLRFSRDRLFAALAEEPFARQEFYSLLQSAPPGRLDIKGIADGLLRSARLGGSPDALLDGLTEAHRNGSLNGKDQQLLLGVAEENPKAIPEALASALEGILTHTEASDVETLTALARVYLSQGKKERARAILRWVVAYDLLGKRAAYREDDPFARIDAYVATFPLADQKARASEIFGRLRPMVLDRQNDSIHAKRLLQLTRFAEPAEVDRELEAMRGLAAASNGSGLDATWTAIGRLQAQAGRIELFEEAVKHALQQEDASTLYSQWDPRSLLPPATGMKDAERYVDVIIAHLPSAFSKQEHSRIRLVSALSLLGQWCVENRLKDKATSLLQRAEQAAGPLGPVWLWVADLAELTGQIDKALDIEVRLLKSNQLPVGRVPDLLATVEARRSQTEADQFAGIVATYSDHPAVLQRAVRAARRENSTDQIRAYENRLKAASRTPNKG